VKVATSRVVTDNNHAGLPCGNSTGFKDSAPDKSNIFTIDLCCYRYVDFNSWKIVLPSLLAQFDAGSYQSVFKSLSSLHGEAANYFLTASRIAPNDPRVARLLDELLKKHRKIKPKMMVEIIEVEVKNTGKL